MYFHTDNDNVVQHLANDLMAACANRQKVRITVDGYGRLRYKVGEGMWTGPIDSTPDPYRDQSDGGVIKFQPGEVWLDPETGEFSRES